MPNPDPSLTPEAAAEEYRLTVLGRTDVRRNHLAGVDFLAGHAHATVALSARLQEVERERDVKLQEAVDASAFSVSAAMMEVRIAQLSRVNARLNRELAEAQKTVQLQWHSERVLKQKLAAAETKTLQSLTVVEKMRAVLEELQRHFNCGCTSGAFIYECNACRLKRDFINPALSTPPSLALLEFAEKVWKESKAASFGSDYRHADSTHEQWLASETYRSLTRGEDGK